MTISSKLERRTKPARIEDRNKHSAKRRRWAKTFEVLAEHGYGKSRDEIPTRSASSWA